MDCSKRIDTGYARQQWASRLRIQWTEMSGTTEASLDSSEQFGIISQTDVRRHWAGRWTAVRDMALAVVEDSIDSGYRGLDLQ